MITARNIYHHTQNTNFLPLCPLILYECGGEKIIGRIFSLHKYGLSVLFCYIGSTVRFFQLFNLNRWFILVFLLREQERYLLRIQELEIAVARLGEESIDKATLLETAQSDKETISRSALKLLGPLHF